MVTDSHLIDADVQQLRTNFAGPLLRPFDERYEEVCSICVQPPFLTPLGRIDSSPNWPRRLGRAGPAGWRCFSSSPPPQKTTADWASVPSGGSNSTAAAGTPPPPASAPTPRPAGSPRSALPRTASSSD